MEMNMCITCSYMFFLFFIEFICYHNMHALSAVWNSMTLYVCFSHFLCCVPDILSVLFLAFHFLWLAMTDGFFLRKM